LSPQVVSDATSRWFSGSVIRPVQHSEDLTAGDDLLVDEELWSDDELLQGEDPLSNNASDNLLLDVSEPKEDPLLLDEPDLLTKQESVPHRSPLNLNQRERFEPTKMIPGGGWYRDDLTLAIRYRGGSHDDPTLRAIIESMHQVKSPASSHDLAQTLAIKACLDCHVGMDPARVPRPLGWMETPRIGRPDRSTKFSHVPHLNIASIADCKSCHAISNEASPSMVTAVSNSASRATQEFVPLNKANCATCHQSHAAGDQCTTCHRYHLPSPLTESLPTSDF
jgi:hypothetical protein